MKLNWYGLVAAVACTLFFAMETGEARAANTDPMVWDGDQNTWLRDPNLYRTKAGRYILSGTRKHIVEYPGVTPGSFEDEDGKAYPVRLFAPNGTRNLRASGFIEWGKKFFRSSSGVVLILSLPTVADFNTGSAPQAGRRSSYVFVPINGGRVTTSGFPLDWRMRSNQPFLRSIYNGGIYDTGRGNVFVYADVRTDAARKTTCLRVQQMSRGLKLGEPKTLICPGRRVPKSVDRTGWERNRPYRSEVRFGDGGGLVEGAWIYRSPNSKYYVLYSSGDYKNNKLYGGFVAVCHRPAGYCQKTLRADGGDVRAFVKGASKNYERVGRAFPVLDGRGQLVDIIFHARPRGGNADDILRCTNFHPGIIEAFAQGGPGCEFDDIVYR